MCGIHITVIISQHRFRITLNADILIALYCKKMPEFTQSIFIKLLNTNGLESFC